MSDGLTRREFVLSLSSVVAAPALLGLTRKGGPPILGGYVDDDSGAGHALRDRRGAPLGSTSSSRERRRVSVAIVGGGIGGLSAAWQLDRSGVHDWLLLELADRTGGNARGGSSAVTRFPWGAHYVPVPSDDATHVRALFRELGVLGVDGTWDERTLCHSPQERIFQHGRWHEGLAPLDALPVSERAQFAEFETRIADWRHTGAFTVPSAMGHARRRSSADSKALAALDTTTADAWLREHGLTSPALRWWVEYGTRDDYGASLTQASAWAAVHYFAGRDPEAPGPLTWPEGNAWITERLTARLNAARSATAAPRIRTSSPVSVIERIGSRWLVRTAGLDVECDVVVWAAPLFVLPTVLAGAQSPVALEYGSWVVANISLRRAPSERGAPLAWDNVIYNSPSLGYVNAGHQSLATPTEAQVWTWYHAVVDRDARGGRRWLRDRPWSQWRDQIVADLRAAHPDVESCVSRIDVMRWGHAMPRPTPGHLLRVRALAGWQPAPRVFIGHADLSGISLMEEAQWHGVRAAQQAAVVLRGDR